MRLAYDRTVKVARKTFRRWHESKRDDAVQEAVTKMWDQWTRLAQRGGNPEPIIGGLIHYAIMFVKYDRKVSGRSRQFDVFDYRAGMKRQRLSGQGNASPTDRSDPANNWINWRLESGDDPARLVGAVDALGLCLADLNAA
jgi:hypothetical protein